MDMESDSSIKRMQASRVVVDFDIASSIGLTKRHLDVLREWADGNTSDKVLAKRLVISTGTVKRHVNAIFTILEVSGKADAFGVAIRTGVLNIIPKIDVRTTEIAKMGSLTS